jgi:hypothetical protein
MKQSEHTLETYVYNHCNMCNISIYFCNTDIKHCNIPLKHLKHLKHTFATRAFSIISPCYLGMEDRRRVEFTDGAKLTALVEDAASPVENATTGPRTLEGRGG